MIYRLLARTRGPDNVREVWLRCSSLNPIRASGELYGESVFRPRSPLGCVTEELRLRKYLGGGGHTFGVTFDKDWPGCRFERELPDAEVVMFQPFWLAWLAA